MKCRLVKYAVFSVALLAINGCSLLFHTVKAHVNTPDENVSLTLSNDEENITYGNTINVPDTTHPGSNSHQGVFKLDKNTDTYSVYETKDGYFPANILVARCRFNPVKLIDIGLPLGCGLFVYSSPNLTSQNPPVYYTFMFIESLVGWIPVGYGPWWTFGKTYTMPALQPVHSRQKGENNFYVKDIDADMNKDSISVVIYKNYRKYRRQEVLYKSAAKGDYEGTGNNIRVKMNDVLETWKYIDTDRHSLANLAHQTVYVTGSISSMRGTTISGFTSFKVASEWQLHLPKGATVAKARYETSTLWTFFGDNTDDFASAATDALSRSLARFIGSGEVQQYLKDTAYKAHRVNLQDTLKITTIAVNDTGGAKNLEEAATAVVTITGQPQPASGCIISPDGYIITTSYALNDTNNDIKVVMSDGSKVVARRIRSNDSNDIALLKIQKPGHYKYLVPAGEKDISVGADVYAIGTPVSEELLQSISKGIISGRRKIEKRKFIQTDVAINPGVNGGALVNGKGMLLGMIVGKIEGSDIQGLGFAMPAYCIEDALGIKFVK